MRALLTFVTAAAVHALPLPLVETVAQVPDLTGRWRVDYELSDDLHADPPTASGEGDPRQRGGRFGGFGEPGNFER